MRCAWRNLASADGASPSASATAPSACATIASSIALSYRCRELAELEACRPRLLDLARGERDLDLGREERRPLERLGDFGVRAADRRERRLDPSLREPKLREAGLRFPAEPARLAVRLLGGVELALEPQKLCLPVVRDARGGILGLDEPPPRETRLLERIRP